MRYSAGKKKYNVSNTEHLDIIFQNGNSKGVVNTTAFMVLFEKLIGNIFKDFCSHPYTVKYYLAMPEETVNCHALDFLSEGEGRRGVFREILKRARKKRGIL